MGEKEEGEGKGNGKGSRRREMEKRIERGGLMGGEGKGRRKSK